MSSQSDLDLLFHPRSVAIIGATNQVWGGGGLMLKSITMNNFPGQIYPVHPREKELAGLPVYPDVSQIPGEVDVAVVAIAARGVPQVIRECRQKGVKFVIIHSSGFGELNEQGQKLEEEMLKIVSEGGPRIIGANSMGIYCPGTSFNTVLTYEAIAHEPGHISFVGQSGWGSENFVRLGLEQGLRFNKVVSIGNQCDLTIEDFLGYFAADPETQVIASHVEGLKRPKDFFKLASEISQKKPVVFWKGSRSRSGASASVSHTGSLAGNELVFEAALKQTGVIMTTGLKELIDVALGLTCPALPRGNAVGLVVSSGGLGIACCDAIESTGLKLAVLPEKVQKELYDYLIPMTAVVPNVSNPVDVGWLPSWSSTTPYLKCLEMILDHVDMALLMWFRPLNEEVLQELKKVRDRFGKPIVVVPGHSLREKEGISIFSRNGIPTYAYPEDGIRALAALWQYAVWKNGYE